MEKSKEYLKTHNIVPSISFKEIPVHTVKILKDKIDSITNDKNELIEGVRYLVEEKGEQKNFFTSSSSLIQKLSDVNEGEEVTIEMKSRKTETGWISYYEVRRTGEDNLPSNDTDDPGF